MRTTSHRITLASAALCAVAATAAGDLNSNAMAARYADFQKQQTQKWALTKTLNTLTLGLTSTVTNVVDRALRYQIKLTSGVINPTNTPVFGSDIAGRQAQQQLDAQIGFSAARMTATGKDVVVAVLDSGFNLNHPAIASRVLPYGFDAVQHDWNAQDRGNGKDDDKDGYVDDGVGHGTFVSGMILLAAPGAWILPVKIADDEGYGMEDELISGIDFAESMGANVINLSFEAGALSLNVCNKLQEANSKGIVVVVSAGNDGSDQTKTMAQSGVTIPVGAVNANDVIAPWSNTPSDGRGLALFAPGVNLYGPHGGPTNDANCIWSGTSFSAPLATGAAALVLEMSPGISPQQVAMRLRAASSAPVTASNGQIYPYAGRLDLRRVVSR